MFWLVTCLGRSQLEPERVVQLLYRSSLGFGRKKDTAGQLDLPGGGQGLAEYFLHGHGREMKSFRNLIPRVHLISIAHCTTYLGSEALDLIQLIDRVVVAPQQGQRVGPLRTEVQHEIERRFCTMLLCEF